jgi:arabinofuranosyltransferase
MRIAMAQQTIPVAETPPRRRVDGARVATFVLFALPLVVLAIGAWRYRWMSDDGFINLRVVRQIQAGHGPVFNAGERVEASTSPLWVAVLTALDFLLPLRLEWIAVLTGIAATLTGVAFVLAGARRLVTGDVIIPTGIWVLVAFAPMWKFASSGLENGLFTLWFGLSFWLLAKWTGDERPLPSLPSAVIVGLGPLIRPDLAVLSAALLIAVFVVSRASVRTKLRYVAVALVLPVVFEIFRMGYYDSLAPNTAAAKEASRSWWSQGLRYVRDSGRPYWLWIPLFAVIVMYFLLLRGFLAKQERRRLALTVACAAGGLVHLLYVARVGGDFMHARMVLPGLTAIIAPVAVTVFDRRFVTYAVTAVVLVWALVAIVALRSSQDAPVTFIGSPRNAVTLADYGWQKNGPMRQWLKGPGVYFLQSPVPAAPRAGLPPLVTADYGVGIGSYALGTDTYVLDMLGLGDAFTAHLRLDHRGVIAHEKPLPLPWVAARLLAPDAAVNQSDFPMPSFFIARPLDHPVGTFQDRVGAARQALTCGELRAFLSRVQGHLGAGQFVSNLWHSLGDTRMRIPPEPADAVKRYC